MGGVMVGNYDVMSNSYMPAIFDVYKKVIMEGI
jgi:hypothetical protein